MMILNGRGRSTITVLREGARDWAGDKISGATDSHQVHSVLVEWNSTNSSEFREEVARSTGTLYMPMGSDVKATDRVELASGEVVAVNGKPFTYNMGLIKGTAVRFKVVGNGS